MRMPVHINVNKAARGGNTSPIVPTTVTTLTASTSVLVLSVAMSFTSCPYAVYEPDDVYFKIVSEPSVVTVGEPVVVPE